MKKNDESVKELLHYLADHFTPLEKFSAAYQEAFIRAAMEEGLVNLFFIEDAMWHAERESGGGEFPLLEGLLELGHLDPDEARRIHHRLLG